MLEAVQRCSGHQKYVEQVDPWMVRMIRMRRMVRIMRVTRIITVKLTADNCAKTKTTKQ